MKRNIDDIHVSVSNFSPSFKCKKNIETLKLKFETKMRLNIECWIQLHKTEPILKAKINDEGV
jgi:hypothetical protein